MKIELRIPTAEQYAYVGLEIDSSEELTSEMIERAASDYRRATEAIRGGEGIRQNEFDTFIQNQLSGEANHIDTYVRMSDEQRLLVQVVKRALQRIQYKINKEEGKSFIK